METLFRWFFKFFQTKSAVRTEAVKRPPLNQKGASIVPKGTDRIRYGCGHDGWVNFAADIYGQVVVPKRKTLRGREKCPTCLLTQLLEGTIRCARCGLIITPNDAVILYAKHPADPDYTVMVNDCAIGCTRSKCRPLNKDFISGYWTGAKFMTALIRREIEVSRAGRSAVAAPIDDK